MEKVLIITYYFPPIGMGGVQRVSKFAKYLPHFDWEPIVITVKDISYYFYDKSLLNDVKDVKIIRTESLDPLRISMILKKIFQIKRNKINERYKEGYFKKIYNIINKWFFIPDSKILWVPFAIVSALKVIKRENIKLIFTTSPPNSCHLAGLFLKKLIKVKWISDFRDYWSINGISKYPTFFHRFINDFIKKKIIKNADCIIAVSDGIIDEMKRHSVSHKFYLITNGFDCDDFPEYVPKKNYDKFHIIHSGTFNYINNPSDFLSGLAMAVKENPQLRNDLLFLHTGISIDYNLKDESKKRRINDLIIEKGYVEHKESLKLLLNSDLLLFVLSDLGYSGIISGKIFEYLASNIPILAITPEGEASDLIRKYNRGIVCKNNDVDSIKNAILSYYDQWKKEKIENGRTGKLRDTFYVSEDLQIFSRKNLTENLKDIFVKLVRVR